MEKKDRNSIDQRQGNLRELYVIKDIIAEHFGPIFEAPNVGVAQRNFRNLIKNHDTPNDFELYRIGYLDNTNMDLIPELTCFTNNEEKMIMKVE